MEDKRLSMNDREQLKKLAEKLVSETQDRSELDKAYSVAAQAIRASLERQYPRKDMLVLKRYDLAVEDTCVYVSRGYYDRDQFVFATAQESPLRPSAQRCNHRTFGLEGDDLAAFDAWKSATDLFNEAKRKRYRDFVALIDGSTKFNQIVEVWPAAEQMRETICGKSTALMVLSHEVVDRIKADPATILQAA